MLSQLLGGNPSGAILFLALVSLPIAWIISSIIKRLYTQAVTSHQKQIQSSPQWIAQPLSNSSIAAKATEFNAQSYLASQGHKEKALLLAYGCAGTIHALIATVIQLKVYQSTITPLKIFTLSFVFIWPLILTVWLITSTSKNVRFQSTLGYAFSLMGMSVLSGVHFFGFFILWIGTMAIPTLILLCLSQRALQAIGHFVLPVVLLVGLGINISISFLVFDWGVLTGLLFGLVLISGITWLSWQGIKWSIQQYVHKKYSERMLLIDAWWLTFTLWELFIFSTSSNIGFGVLLGFIGYKATLWYFLNQHMPAEKNPPLRLLWLRVFGRQYQSTELLDTISNKWRNIGNIQMIAGEDLATTFLEPHQLLEFWRKKLRDQFIQSPEQLAEQMTKIDLLPDPDGRYRVTQFFCLNNNWPFIFNTLLKVSNTILMDLRGFKEANKGVRYELEMLFNHVPAQGFVIIVDAPVLDDQMNVLSEIWQSVNRNSPNFNCSFSNLKIIKYTPSKVQKIIQSLSESSRHLH